LRSGFLCLQTSTNLLGSSASSSSQPSPVVITAPTQDPPSKEIASIIDRFRSYTSLGTEHGSTIRDDGDILGVGDSLRDGENGLATASEEVLQRSYSTSTIEDILRSQVAMVSIERMESPRSSSCDDLTSLSGSLTPTLTPTKTHFKL